MKKNLIYGYGNPGRQDDGLGIKFTELFEKWLQHEKINNITVDCNYQLNIEDAALIAEYNTVIFVDASVQDDIDRYKLQRITKIEFTMHAVSPAYVVDICKKIYGKTPNAYILHIKGYEFDFVEELSIQAVNNMLDAFKYMKEFIKRNLIN